MIRRALLLLLVASSLTAQQRRGAFAFRYAPDMTPADLEWYGRFDVLVTHDCVPSEQVRVLHARGTKVFFYEWSVAFYATRADGWEDALMRAHSAALLNATGLRGGVGAPDADAFYFDPANREAMRQRATHLVARLDRCGYDGIFFDTTRFESVHDAARAAYTERHPGADYDAEFARFLRDLHDKMGRRLLFTNQGFRDGDHYLPTSAWDLTESYVTYPQKGRFVARPWNDAADPWNSTRFILAHLIAPAMKRHPRVRFAHLNYVDERDPSIIRLAVAAAHLFDGEAYVVGPTTDAERDPVYFWDPGKPTGPRIDARDGTVSYRFFRNGVIIVNGSDTPFTLPLKGRYENLVTGEPLSSISVPAAAPAPVAILLRRIE